MLLGYLGRYGAAVRSVIFKYAEVLTRKGPSTMAIQKLFAGIATSQLTRAMATFSLTHRRDNAKTNFTGPQLSQTASAKPAIPLNTASAQRSLHFTALSINTQPNLSLLNQKLWRELDCRLMNQNIADPQYFSLSPLTPLKRLNFIPIDQMTKFSPAGCANLKAGYAASDRCEVHRNWSSHIMVTSSAGGRRLNKCGVSYSYWTKVVWGPFHRL
jgi:hypothetical protein